MSYVSILLVTTMLVVWVIGAAWQIWSGTRKSGWRRVVSCLATILMTVGAFGFFGSVLVAMGAFSRLAASFEWPVGFAKGVVATTDHSYFVVPHTPTGRVQIYERNWKFLRGWNVSAGGGAFKLYITDTNGIHVVTARGHKHHVYDLAGNLLSSETYPDSRAGYSSFPNDGDSYVVPTPIWLWVFSNPFFSWLAAALGLAFFIAEDKMSTKSEPAGSSIKG
jgi:hypothetical protein